MLQRATTEEGLIFRLRGDEEGQRGSQETCHRHIGVIENCRERRSPCTIFGRGVFLSLALGVPKDAPISRRKKRAVSCPPPVAFHDAVSRALHGQSRKKIRGGRVFSGDVCTQRHVRFSTNWATRRIGNIYFDSDKASRLRGYFRHFHTK